MRDDGTIEHLHPPEYHGDPLDPGGCLCFHHFGWDLLDLLRDAGFRSVTAYSVWSRRCVTWLRKAICFSSLLLSESPLAEPTSPSGRTAFQRFFCPD